MFSVNKNSYLQTNYKEINPRLINRCVQRALDFIQIDEHDLEPPFNRLTSEQPNILIQNADATRRPAGFGKKSLIKLRRELHDKTTIVVVKALESICDLVYNAEKGYEFIELKIIDRMVDLLAHDNTVVRERTCRTLAILARLAAGREAITQNKLLLENISICVEDISVEVRIQSAALLEMLASSWRAADVLIDTGFISILLGNLINEKISVVCFHLQTLKSLMYGIRGQIKALESQAFPLFVTLLDSKQEEIISAALECLSLLTSTCPGEKMAKEINLIKKCVRFLYDERPSIHANAVSVIMFLTVKTHGKLKASQIPGLTKKLVELCRNSLNRRTQIFAIKALSNISEHTAVRRDIKENFMKDINNIQVGGDPYIARYKKLLIDIISWTPDKAS